MTEPPVLAALRAGLPADTLRTGAEIGARHAADWSGLPPCPPLALLLPRSTAEVAAALAVCHAHGQPVVPQGGLTGLAGGARPGDGDIALSLERMSGVEEIDGAAGTLTALAGTPLEAIQRAAEDAGFYCGLDLGARGSCTIGGNLATNAGGNRVIRYGMARQHVLGLEAVLADGTVVRSLNKMLKNNAGYDWKQLFIGSEGTLGVITRVVLRLLPPPTSTSCAVLALAGFDQALSLLHAASAGLNGTLSAFEVMWPEFYHFATERAGVPAPLPPGQPLYVLIEAQGGDPQGDPDRFERFLAERYEAGAIADAVIAQSLDEGRQFWALRDAPGEYPRFLPDLTAFDVSLPLGRMAEAVDALRQALEQRWPGCTHLFYGHIGDSNLHLVVHLPGIAEQPHHEIESLVYGLVAGLDGTISAEHGIGVLKRAFLPLSRQPAELALMRTLKQALDPRGILNPGKVL